jgi:hypothetical protein
MTIDNSHPICYIFQQNFKKNNKDYHSVVFLLNLSQYSRLSLKLLTKPKTKPTNENKTTWKDYAIYSGFFICI